MLEDGRRKVVRCVDKCCRSQYALAASAKMDQAIDPRKLLSNEEFSAVVRETYKALDPIGIALRFIAFTGCRLTESTLVRSGKYQTDGKIPMMKIPTIKRKGRPERSVDIHDPAFAEELGKWQKTIPDGQPLFAVAKRTMQNRLQTVFKRLKIVKDALVHVFRHTRASQLSDAGFPLAYVVAQLGWSSMEMAKIYTHSNEDQRLRLGGKLPKLTPPRKR